MNKSSSPTQKSSPGEENHRDKGWRQKKKRWWAGGGGRLQEARFQRLYRTSPTAFLLESFILLMGPDPSPTRSPSTQFHFCAVSTVPTLFFVNTLPKSLLPELTHCPHPSPQAVLSPYGRVSKTCSQSCCLPVDFTPLQSLIFPSLPSFYLPYLPGTAPHPHPTPTQSISSL